MTETKNLLLRLEPEVAERLRAIAEIEQRSVSAVAREAIAALVEKRAKDKKFRRLLDSAAARHAALFDSLDD